MLNIKKIFNQNELLIPSIVLFVVKSFSILIVFVYNMLAARLLEQHEFGRVSLLITISTLLVYLTTFGIPMFVTRDVAIYFNNKNWHGVFSLYKSSYRIMFSIYTIIFVVLVPAYFVFEFKYFISIYDAMLCLGIVFVLSVNTIRAAIIRGLGKVLLADISEQFIRPLIILIILLFLLVGGLKIDGSNFLFVYLLSSIVALVVGYIILKKYLSNKIGNNIAIRKYNIDYKNDVLPFFLITLFTYISGQISFFFVAYYRGAAAAGGYYASMQIAAVIPLILMITNAQLQSKIPSLWKNNKVKKIQHIMNESALIGLIYSSIAVLTVVFFSERLLGLFGEEYKPFATALYILATAQFINVTLGSGGVLLMMSNHQYQVLYGLLLSIFLNLVSGYFLVPEYNYIGAAISALISISTWNIYFSIICIKKLKINPTIIHAMKFIRD